MGSWRQKEGQRVQGTEIRSVAGAGEKRSE